MLAYDPFQRKYKEAGKKAATSSLYSALPETLETQHAREASQLQSQVGPIQSWMDGTPVRFADRHLLLPSS